jgi:hypothetical protein
MHDREDPHRIVIGESPHFLMSATVEARAGGSRDPHDMTIAHGARRDRDGNPSKTIDSLACKNRCRRLRIHVVDGHHHVVGAVVVDSERYRIVGASRGGQQHRRQGEAGKDDGLNIGTHLPSQGC